MLLVRRKISKWTALFDLILTVPAVHGLRFTPLKFNSKGPALTSVETEVSEQNEEFDDTPVSLNEELANENGTKKKKKRKRITTRARKVIPGLSFLVLHFLLEY